MSGFSPKLPLAVSAVDGFYALNKNIKELTKQNLKMLILTSPGERMMDPAFGAGIRTYLFEPYGPDTINSINEAIFSQVKNYMPYIVIKRLNVLDLSQDRSLNLSVGSAITLGIRLEYYVKNLNLVDVLEIINFTN